MIAGSKYKPLQEYLQRNNSAKIMLTLTEIEEIIGDTLPDSARTTRQWWGNRSKGALQAASWMNAGFVVNEINLDQQNVTFIKPSSSYKVKTVSDAIKWNSESIKALREKMGLTQSQLAEELGVRQQTVYQI